MARKERLVAVFAPSIRSIKLYADGRIEYQGKSGSVIGARARVEKSGERRRLRDTREVVLRIDGPSVAIAAPLPPAGFQVHKQAEQFAAKVNAMSGEVDGSVPAPAPDLKSAPDPPGSVDQSIEPDTSAPARAGAYGSALMATEVLIGQLERLGKLRDCGVLTEEEFQEEKTALLRAAHKRERRG